MLVPGTLLLLDQMDYYLLGVVALMANWVMVHWPIDQVQFKLGQVAGLRFLLAKVTQLPLDKMVIYLLGEQELLAN